MPKHLGCIALMPSGAQPLIGVVDLVLPALKDPRAGRGGGALFHLCYPEREPDAARPHMPFPFCCHRTAPRPRQTHASPRQIVIIERRPEIEVSVCARVSEGGCGNVPVVNYTLDSRIPSEASAAAARRISAAWLINLLTNIK